MRLACIRTRNTVVTFPPGMGSSRPSAKEATARSHRNSPYKTKASPLARARCCAALLSLRSAVGARSPAKRIGGVRSFVSVPLPPLVCGAAWQIDFPALQA